MDLRNILSTWTRSRLSFSKLLLSLLVVFIITGCSEKGAEDYMQEAAAFSENGDPKAAVVSLKNAVQEAPRLASARFELGKVHLQLSSFDEASKELSRALEYGYSENQVIPLLAEALARSGANVALSDLSYDASLLTPEEQLEVGARKVASLIELEKAPEALVLVEELLTIDAETTYKGMLKGYQLIIAENYVEALNTLKVVLEGDTLNRDVISLTARLYILTGDIENATNLYEEYIAVAQDDIQAKFALVNILMQQNQSERAEKYIDELLEINSNNGMLNQLKATARAAADDNVAAKEFAEKAINSGRGAPTLRLIAGFASYKLKDYESTIRHLSVVSDVLPDEHPALRMLADSQLQLNMGEDAAEVLSRVNEVAQEDLSLFSRTGYELIKAGDTDTAKEMIEQAQTVSQTTEELIRLGALKLTLNNLDGIADIEKAVAQSPDSVQAKTTLAGAYLATNQINKAMVFAKKWQQEQPNIVEGYLLEADILSTQQKYSEAGAKVNEALSIDTDNSFAQLANIRLDMLKENYKEALGKVERLLTKEPSNVKALASYFKIQDELGDSSQAFAKIESAHKSDLENEPLRLLFASVLIQNRKFSETLEVLSHIDANRLTLSSYWRLKGMALFNTSNLTDSNAHYTQWAAYFPNQLDPTLGLLNVLDLQRDFVRAAKVANDFLANTESVQVRMMASYFMTMSKDVAGAKQAMKKIDEQFLELPYMRGVKARIALLEKRGMQGIEDARAAYFAKKSPDNLLLFVQTLDSAGQTAQAFPVIEQHVNDFPTDIRSKALFAERQVARDPVKALALYEEMLIDFPNSPVLLNNAAYLHFEAQNMEKALEYSTKAFTASPTNIDFADTYAQVLIQRGDTEQAVEAYNQAITDSLSNEELILNYLEALFLNNNTIAAKRRVQQFKSRLKSQESKDRLFDLQVKYMN